MIDFYTPNQVVVCSVSILVYTVNLKCLYREKPHAIVVVEVTERETVALFDTVLEQKKPCLM